MPLRSGGLPAPPFSLASFLSGSDDCWEKKDREVAGESSVINILGAEAMYLASERAPSISVSLKVDDSRIYSRDGGKVGRNLGSWGTFLRSTHPSSIARMVPKEDSAHVHIRVKQQILSR